MKDFNILIFLNNDNIIIDDLKTNIEEFLEKIKEIKFKKLIIIISDWNVYQLNFKIKLKKLSEAKKAAENQLLYLNPDSSYNPKYFSIELYKSEDGYNTTIYYLSKEAEEFLNIVISEGLKNKIVHILPMFEILKELLNSYKIEDYITLITQDKVITFHEKDSHSFENLYTKDSLKEIDLNYMKHFDFKKLKDTKVDFLMKNKSFEIFNKIFYPVLITIIIINLIIFSFIKFEYIKTKKEYKRVKKINLKLKKQIEPVIKTEEILNKLKKINQEISIYSYQVFPFIDFFKALSKLDKIFINNFYLRNNTIRISGKTKSALKLLEILKKLKYLENPKIISNIVRDSYGNERFQIEAKINYGK